MKYARRKRIVSLSSIQLRLLSVLAKEGPIRGTAKVGHVLWPDRDLQSQGAALAAGNVLRSLQQNGYVACRATGRNRKSKSYRMTKAGQKVLAENLAASVDPRQLSLFPITPER